MEMKGIKTTTCLNAHLKIQTNQSNKKIVGWQGIKVDLTRFNQLLPKMQVCNMAELRKRKRKWNPLCHLVAGEFNIGRKHLTLL